KCYNCQGMGHTAKRCENKTVSKYSAWRSVDLSKKREGMKAASWRKQVAKIDASNVGDKKPRCNVIVGETDTMGVVDTGADKTQVPEKTVSADAPICSFTMADGKSILWSKGPVDVELKVGDLAVTHPVYTYKGDETIIGSDLLDKYGAVIDYANNKSITFT